MENQGSLVEKTPLCFRFKLPPKGFCLANNNNNNDDDSKKQLPQPRPPHLVVTDDLSSVVSGNSWCMTAKRGRKSLSSCNIEESRGLQPGIEHRVNQSINDLLLRVYMMNSMQMRHQRVVDEDAELSPSASKKPKIERTMMKKNEKEKKNDKKIKQTNTETGHRSSIVHTIKSENVRIMDKQTESETLQVGGRYRCTTCGKIFPTGQALGGHMRYHWIRNLKAHAASLEETSTQAQNKGPMTLNLDLNEPLDMDGEEGVWFDSAASGYASFCHN